MSALTRLWLSQFLSLFGTDATRFALRVWTFSQTGSARDYALITFFAEMPAILLSPVVGGLVDAFPRKSLMILSDAIAALGTFALFFLHSNGALLAWHVHFAAALSSLCNSIQYPAFISSISLIVPKEKLVKVNGWNQAANGISMMLAPLLGGFLVQFENGLQSVFFIEFATFILAVLIVMGTAIPDVKDRQTDESASPLALLSSSKPAINFISSQPGLIFLLILLSQTQFLSGLVNVLLTPLILSFGTPLQLASVLTFSGIGAMLGFVIPVYLKIEDRVLGVLLCVGVQGFMLSLVGLWEKIGWVLFIAVSCGYELDMFMVPLSRALRESIWQSKTPPHLQGRVFALQQSIQKLSLPLAALIAGPLNDAVFEPAMQPNGYLAQSFLGKVLGTGKGRGAAAMLMLGALANVASVLIGFRMKGLRELDVLLPDWKEEGRKEKTDEVDVRD